MMQFALFPPLFMPKMLGIMVGMNRKNSAGIIEIPQVQYLDKVDGYFYGFLWLLWWLGGLRLRACNRGKLPLRPQLTKQPVQFLDKVMQPVAIPQGQFLDKVWCNHRCDGLHSA